MTRRGRPTGHKPHNIGRMNKGRTNPCVSASPLVRHLFALLDDEGRAMDSVATQAGPSLVTLSRWRNGRTSPKVIDFESVCGALGYRLVLRPLSPMTSDTDGRMPADRAE